MAVRERRRQKEKKKKGATKEVEKPSEAPKETTVAVEQKPDVEIEKQHTIQIEVKEVPEVVAQTEVAEIVEPKLLLPKWGDINESEWMYGIPPRDEDKDLWAEEWSDFLLRWMEEHNVHIVSVSTFISETPFKDMSNKVTAFRLVAEELIDKKIAEWRDKKNGADQYKEWRLRAMPLNAGCPPRLNSRANSGGNGLSGRCGGMICRTYIPGRTRLLLKD